MAARKAKTEKKAKSLPPLKVVVMSATLDVETFQDFFTGADTINIPGRQFPVQVLYTNEPQEVSDVATIVLLCFFKRPWSFG